LKKLKNAHVGNYFESTHANFHEDCSSGGLKNHGDLSTCFSTCDLRPTALTSGAEKSEFLYFEPSKGAQKLKKCTMQHVGEFKKRSSYYISITDFSKDVNVNSN
jgi:hypothetical protein